MRIKQNGSLLKCIIRTKSSNIFYNHPLKEKEITVVVFHLKDKGFGDMEKLKRTLCIIALILALIAILLSCTTTHKLQKEPGYEQYQKNQLWKN